MIGIVAAIALFEAAAGNPPAPLAKPLSERTTAFLTEFNLDPAPVECIDELKGGRDQDIDRTIWLDKFHLAFEMEDNGFFINELDGRHGCKGGKNALISYDVAAKSFREGICKGDGVRTFSSGANPSSSGVNSRLPFGRCKLGSFYRLSKKSVDGPVISD